MTSECGKSSAFSRTTRRHVPAWLLLGVALMFAHTAPATAQTPDEILTLAM
jgi:hypothetical protein